MLNLSIVFLGCIKFNKKNKRYLLKVVNVYKINIYHGF